MHIVIGFALSLVLSAPPKPYEGPNGFDPNWMTIVNQGGHLAFDASQQSGPFVEWLNQGSHEDRENRLHGLGYFIACAFDQDTVIRFKDQTWRGHLGLAPSLKSKVLTRRTSLSSISLGPTLEEGRWISSCLMAFANLEGSHEYILMRGNFPSASAKPLTAGQRWTMGYPEGVFFADLINFNLDDDGRLRSKPRPATPSQKEMSFTLSLNLPEDYQVDQSAPPWAPPNASNGRSLDYSRVTTQKDHRIATRLGTYLGAKKYFRAMEKPTDPDYRFDAVCVSGQQLVACDASGAQVLRPVYVHAPRMVSLATATGNVVDPTLAIQALDSGQPLLADNVQKQPCEARKTCTGRFHASSVGEAPRAPTEPKSRFLAGLKEGQSVTVLLGFDSEREHYQLAPQDLAEPFTAIVRYRSNRDAVARIEVEDAAGRWREEAREWKATFRGEWALMQVFPVYASVDPSGQPFLKFRISGVGDGARSPELDLAGFVSAEPWCLGKDELKFARRCSEETLPVLQAAQPRFRAATPAR
jgi:hypothetical protein